MNEVKQRRVVEINRGLFLVRYTVAEDEAHPPKVKISPDPLSDRNIEIVLHPDHMEAALWQPGTCLLVRAMTAGKLSVDVEPIRAGGSAVATVKIEPLSQGRVTFDLPPATDESSFTDDLKDFRVLGHIAGIGDVFVSGNDWLAGPSAPSRIEGISIEWPGKPRDLELRYSVRTAGPQAISGRIMEIGSFAGTRRKALPVVGLMLEMSGPGASNFQFVAEAVFLGSPVMRITGQRVVMSGPTGREPLVGLKVGLQKGHAIVRPRPPATPAQTRSRGSSGVRVFRSKSKQDQSTTF
jgi:hypothetical protein